MYEYQERQPVFGGMDRGEIIALGELGMLDSQDYVALRGMDRQDYVSLGRLPGGLPNPAFVGIGAHARRRASDIQVMQGLGQSETAGAATVAAVGVGALVLSAAISFGLMVGAAFLGARWAGCRAQA